MEDQKTAGWTWTLALCIWVSFFGCLIGAGYNISVLNAPQEVLLVACNASLEADFGMVLEKGSLQLVWSALVAVFLIGAALGSLLGGAVADAIGRRLALLATQLVLAGAGVLLSLGFNKQHMILFFAGRFLVGFGAGMATTICPLYIHEVSPPQLQGALGSLTNLGLNVGLLSAQILGLPDVLGGTADTVTILLGAFLIPTLVAAAFIPLCPESPKYLLIQKNREEDAVEALSRLRGLPLEALSAELSAYRAESKLAAESPRWSLRRVLLDSGTRRRLLILVLLNAGQQLSGVNAVFFFSTAIFRQAGLSVREGALASVGTGAANVVMAALAGVLLTRFSERALLTVSSLGCSVCLTGFAIALQYMEQNYWAAALGVSLLILFVVSFALGLGPVPWMIGAQMFEQAPRPKALSVGSASNWITNFFVVLLFPIVYTQTGPACFALFVVFNLISTCAALWGLPHSFKGDQHPAPAEKPALV